MCSRSAGTPICATMSRLLDSDTVTSRGIARATFICISRNPYQRRRVKRAPRARGVLEVEVAVDGDRVVQRGEHRPAVVHHPEQAGAEALVVVDEVEVGAGGPASSRRARRLNVYGSGKPAAHMMANSWRSIVVLNSHGHGTRNGFSGR